METKYSSFFKFIGITYPVIFYALVTIMGGFIFIATIVKFLVEGFNDFYLGIEYLILSIFMIHIIKHVAVQINRYPIFFLRDEGLMIRLFDNWFTWKFIPWENIQQIEIGKTHYGLKPVWLITTKVFLTRWHTILNHRYGDSSGKQIVITHRVINSKELFEVIEKNIRSVG